MRNETFRPFPYISGRRLKARPVAIIWDDAHHIGADLWLNPADVAPGVRVTTVGLLVSKTRTHYVIAHSLDDSGNITGTFAVPKSTVHKIHPLSKG